MSIIPHFYIMPSSTDLDIKKYFKRLGKELPFAAMVALNEAAREVSKKANQHTDDVVEGGATPFTKRAFKVLQKSYKDGETKQFNLSAVVGTQKIQGEYLYPALIGGERKVGDASTGKKYIFVPSASAPRDARGNIPRNYLKSKTRKRKTSSRTSRRRASKAGSFTGFLNLQGKPTYGVYKRDARGKLSVLALLKKKTQYKANPKFNLRKATKTTFNREMNKNIREAVNDLAKYGKVRSAYRRRVDK